LAKIWLTCLRNLQSEMTSSHWPTTKTPCNHISVVSRRNAFMPTIAPLSPVYDSVTDQFTESKNPISKPNSAWICHIQLRLWPFCDIFAYFGQNMVATETPLDSCNQKCLLWIGQPPKPPVISNHVLAISCRNAFIATLVPKLVVMVTPLCPLCTGMSQTNSLMVQPYLKTKLCMDMLHTTEVMAMFVIFFCLFWLFFAMATSFRLLQSEMSSLDCSTTKTPCCK